MHEQLVPAETLSRELKADSDYNRPRDDGLRRRLGIYPDEEVRLSDRTEEQGPRFATDRPRICPHRFSEAATVQNQSLAQHPRVSQAELSGRPVHETHAKPRGPYGQMRDLEKATSKEQ